jgi:hypothetical protein
MEDKFFMVYVSGRNTPNIIHRTIEEAEAEASRLCIKEGLKTYVLQTVCKLEIKNVEKTIIEHQSQT